MKRSLLILCVLCAYMQANAQRIQGSKYRVQPKDYISKPHQILPKSAERVPSGSNSLWVVYSDRDNNPTFTEPKAGAAVKEKIQFRQPFIVWDEEDEWVRICEYTPEAIDREKKTFKHDVKDYGWVEKRKMLLWQKSVIDPATGFTKKCMAINKYSTFKAGLLEAAKDDKLDLYNEPSKSGPRNGQDARLMTFLFVYDEEGDYYLIGKNDRVSPLTVGDGLLGWVNKDVIQIWSQRMALEPNEDDACLAYRKEYSLPVKFFETEKEAQAFAMKDKSASKMNPLPYEDDFKPLKAGEYRFPVLEGARNGSSVYKTGVISPVFNDKAQEVFDVKEQYVMQDNYEKLRDSKSGINIVFVVDGNPGQRDYMNDVIEAIVKAQNELEFENSSDAYLFEYGAVVYRNENEGSCNGEIQKKPLTGNAKEIIKFLTNEIDRTPCGGKAEYSSLFKGIDAGLKLFATNQQKRGTNVIVLIGGQGNNPAQNAQELPKLISRMADGRVGFLCVQTKTYEMDEAYSDFVFQVGKIAREYQTEMRSLYDEYTTKSGKIRWIDAEDDQAYDLQLNFPEEAPMPCFSDYPEPGKSIEAARLTSIIKKSIIETAQNQQQIFAIGDAKMKGIGERREPNEALLNFISQMDIPGYSAEERREALRKISDKNIQFFFEGYAPVKVEGMKNCDLFRFVILIDENELQELIYKFGDFSNKETFDEQKKSIKESYRAQLASLLGPAETKKALENKTMRELNTLLYGCPGSDKEKIMNLKLEDLDDLEDLNELHKIGDNFQRAAEGLNAYREDASHSFLNGGRRYYWIPQSLMP